MEEGAQLAIYDPQVERDQILYDLACVSQDKSRGEIKYKCIFMIIN